MPGLQVWQLFLVVWSGLAIVAHTPPRLVASEAQPGSAQKTLRQAPLPVDVQRFAMHYRITVYNTFRRDRAEYNRRLAAWDQVYESWLAGGMLTEQKPLVLGWLREATLRSRAGGVGPLPRMPALHAAEPEPSYTARPQLIPRSPKAESHIGGPAPAASLPTAVGTPSTLQEAREQETREMVEPSQLNSEPSTKEPVAKTTKTNRGAPPRLVTPQARPKVNLTFDVPPTTEVPREPPSQLPADGPKVEPRRLTVAEPELRFERQASDTAAREPVAARILNSQRVPDEQFEKQRVAKQLRVIAEKPSKPAAPQPVEILPIEVPVAKPVTRDPSLEELLFPEPAKAAGHQEFLVRRSLPGERAQTPLPFTPRIVATASRQLDLPQPAAAKPAPSAPAQEGPGPTRPMAYPSHKTARNKTAPNRASAARVRVNEVELAARVAGYNRNLRALESRLLAQPEFEVRELARAVAELVHLEELHADAELYLPLLESWQRPHVGQPLSPEGTKRLMRQKIETLRSKLANAAEPGDGGQQRWQLDVLDALKRQLKK